MAAARLLDLVVGQEPAVAALRSHIGRTGGSGSTLLAGPEGTGRFLLAMGAAQLILGGSNEAAAARVASQQHPDLAVIDAEEGIEGVREGIATLAFRPSEGPRRVLIVRDADLLSLEAQNALLKTLEEPPAGAAVLVVAGDPQALPETVVSRCRLVRVRPLSADAMRRLLPRLGLPVGLAEEAEGSPGRALFHHQEKSGEGAAALLRLLRARAEDPLAEADALSRRKPKEESKPHRRRLAEMLRITAFRLRQALPESEAPLRSVLHALRSLGDNVGGPLLMADLSLLPWKAPPPN